MLTGLSLLSIGWLLGMAPAANGAAVAPPPSPAAPATALVERVDLDLLVYPTGVGASTTRQMMTVGSEMLARTGVRIAWTDCLAEPSACGPRDGSAGRAAVVRFTTGASWQREGCGWAVRRPGSIGLGVVTLDMGCVSEFAMSLRNRSDRLVVEAPRLMGALLAHEVGHILGLHHGTNGVMRCTVGVTEWRALATGRLHFSDADRRQIAAALREPATVRTSTR